MTSAAPREPQKKWYVIQTHSGYEAKVRDSLNQRIKQHTMEDKFGEILIPTESVTENRPGGKQRVKERRSLPNYVFVEMQMNEHTWHLVKGTPKVSGFIGDQTPQEVPLSQIENLRKGIVEGTAKPKPKLSFEIGEEVRVLEGAFANFTGTVDEVKLDKQKLKVKVSIFGRPTNVELDFSAVEKR